jgi:Cyclic nucleotide-binding domain.
MNLETIINSIYPLSETSLQQLISETEQVRYPKGYILSYAGKRDYYVYFLEKGIARAYSNRDGTDVTFWFGVEGSVVCSMRNYIEKKPSYETIELLEDSLLHRIRIAALDELYVKNIEIANFGRKFIEQEVMRMDNRVIEQQFLTATERYQALLEHYPFLLQRVPLGIIASYLGITQVSLSRIRSKINF